MKFLSQITGILILIACFFLLINCDKKESTYEYQTKVPVLEKMASIREVGIHTVAPKPLAATGKIYIFNDYLFINEPNEGIHILDNSNPAAPITLSFLEIPGNVDLAVNGGILYADSYVDLLTFDLRNPSRPELIERLEDVFKSQYRYYTINSKEGMVVVDYKDTVVRGTTSSSHFPFITRHNELVYLSDGGSNYGTGGSMARFTLANGHLYTVGNASLDLFHISNARKPTFVKNIPLGAGIETIFPYKDNIFIGSTTGMHIYSITKPEEPKQLAVYRHFTACDPVVVNDNYAFVTLRSGNTCGLTRDVLEVINIQDLAAPKLVKSYGMDNPHGLGLAGNMLYLCEGNFGFKSYNIADVTAIDQNLIAHLKDMKSTDVIPGPKSLIVIGPDGVCQYDYTDKAKIKLLSCISKTII